MPVADILSARIVNFNDDEHMLEMGADVFGCEGQGTGLLKHDGDDVISYVPLSEQLVREENKQEVNGQLKHHWGFWKCETVFQSALKK